MLLFLIKSQQSNDLCLDCGELAVNFKNARLALAITNYIGLVFHEFRIVSNLINRASAGKYMKYGYILKIFFFICLTEQTISY